MSGVWVRGAGAVSPLGATWRETVVALAAGKSAISPVTAFDAEGFPCAVAAAVARDRDENDGRMSMALAAAREAWGGTRADPERIGVFVGAESGRATLATIVALSRAAGGGDKFDHLSFGARARPLVARFDASTISPAAVASALSAEIGARGPSVTISLACASGAAAIAEGTRAVRRGEIDVALCGGVGADVDPLMLAGFGKLGALSARGISCPFDARRDGFVVGEGAAFVVLSRERGESVAEVTGVGRSLDAWHLTAPDPEGDGAARAMSAALAEAGIDRVDYVQAHGTSTPLNDAVEAKAIRRVLGDRLGKVGAVKGAVGHWVAGAGAIGFLCALEAIENGVMLPTAGLASPDPACDLPHLLVAERAEVKAALVNAFAFGGANASIVLERRA